MAVANVILKMSQQGIAGIERQYAKLQARHVALRSQLQRAIRLGKDSGGLENELSRVNAALIRTKSRIRDVGREAQRTRQRMTSLGKGFIQASRGMTQMASRAVQLTFTLGFMARMLGDVATGLTKTGGAVIGARRAFLGTAAAVKSTSQALLGDLRRASRNTISDFGLMSAANFAFLAGAKLTSEELNTLTEASVKLAAIGIRTSAGALLDAEEIFNRFTQGIVKQERRIVDDMTVVIRAKDVMNEFGAAANAAAGGNANLARVIAFKMAIVKAASDRLETLRDVDISLVTVGSELSATFENFKNKLSAMFVETGAGTRLLESMQNILGGIIDQLAQPGEADKFFNGIVEAITAMIQLFKLLIPVLITVLTHIKTIVGIFAGGGLGGFIGRIIGSIAEIPGGPAGILAAGSVGQAIGTGVGAVLGGGAAQFVGDESVTPDQAGREIGRSIEPTMNMMNSELREMAAVIRRQTLQPAFPGAVA